MSDSVVMPHPAKSQLRLRKASLFVSDQRPQLIEAINAVRAHYPWSKKTYGDSGIGNVYAIILKRHVVGFIECAYKDEDFCRAGPVWVFIDELHVAPSAQRQGIGAAVLDHLLSKGLRLEMVVANQNEKMLALVNKFQAEHKHISQHTRTVVIRPPSAVDMSAA